MEASKSEMLCFFMSFPIKVLSYIMIVMLQLYFHILRITATMILK